LADPILTPEQVAAIRLNPYGVGWEHRVIALCDDWFALREQLREAPRPHVCPECHAVEYGYEGKVPELEAENRRLREQLRDEQIAAKEWRGIRRLRTKEIRRLRDAIGTLAEIAEDGLDGGDFQDIMVKHGLFVEVPASDQFREHYDLDKMYVLVWDERALAEIAKEGDGKEKETQEV